MHLIRVLSAAAILAVTPCVMVPCVLAQTDDTTIQNTGHRVSSGDYSYAWGSQAGAAARKLTLHASVSSDAKGGKTRVLSFQIQNTEAAAKSSEANVTVDYADVEALNRDLLAARHLSRLWRNEGRDLKGSQVDYTPVAGLKLTVVRKANTAECRAWISVTEMDVVCIYDIGGPARYGKFVDTFESVKARMQK